MNHLDILRVPETAQLFDGQETAGTQLAWPAIRERITALAVGVPEAGSRSVYGICAENGVETLLAILAVVQAGGVPAPMPPNTDESTVDACLARLGAVGLWRHGRGWVDLGTGTEQPGGFDIIMHSSGSTGVPRPLAIRLEAMRKNAMDVADAASLTEGDVHIGSFSHCYMSGLYNAFVLPLVTGGTAISIPQTAAATLETMIAAIERHQANILWTSPLVAALLTRLRGVEPARLASLRLAVSCTAPLPAEIKKGFEGKFGTPILQSYGLCETLITTIEDPHDVSAGSVGKPVGQGTPVRLDDSGQIIVENGAHFCGYLDSAKACFLEPIEPYSTGDLGRFDASGNLHVSGRLSEVINRDGVKFAPEVVEAVINAMPGVNQSCVVGVPAAKGGTTVVAFIEADGVDGGEVRAALSQQLSSSQVPQQLRFLDELPRTSAGKPNRPAIRELV